MNRLLLYLFSAAAATAFLGGCNGASSRYASDVDTVEVEVVVADTLDGDPLIDESTKLADDPQATHSIPSPRFKTKAEAMDYIKNSGHADAYMSGIFPTMLDDCFDYASRLLNNTHNQFIVVDKASMNVILYDKYGREKRAYRMACGRNYGTKKRKADSRTPEGFFYAQGIYDSTDWLFTNDAGVTSKTKGQFGPRFIRLSTPQIGIHGTGSPWSLGNRVSHGCIRIANENILELVTLVDVGTPILVNPSTRDMGVNRSEGSNVPFFRTGHSGPIPDEAAIRQAEQAAAADRAAAAPDSAAAAPDSATAAPDSAAVIVNDIVEPDSVAK